MCTLKNFGVRFLENFVVDLGETQCVVTICLHVGDPAKTCKMFEGEISADAILYDMRLALSCVGTLVNRFVSNLMSCYT